MKNSLIACAVFLLLAANAACNKNNRIAKVGITSMASGSIDVTTLGANPNDNISDTYPIQQAIDSAANAGGGTVWIPNGDYVINVDSSLHLRNNVIVSMASNARLFAKPTSSDRYYVFLGAKVHGAQILGGQIIGDRNSHMGTTGEWGMGIGLYNCDSITVKYVHISDCWGDGIMVSANPNAPFYAPNASTRIYITGVVSDSNRRQGLSIGKVAGVTVDSCVFSHTNGTAPQDGIDIEPDTDTCKNVTIRNSQMLYNTGNGVEVNQNTHSYIYNINIIYNRIHYNTYAGYVQNATNVDFNYDSIANNKYHPFIVVNNCTNCVTTPNY